MVAAQPQFLLFCDTHLSTKPSIGGAYRDDSNGEGNHTSASLGRWQFVLERLDGSPDAKGPDRLEVADSEQSIHADRLALLSVVRGLEALEQPSRVNLVTTSRYVSRGLKYGLATWREAEYQWERFGVRKPIRNADLWQRVDQALKFHGVTCRLIQSSVARPESQTYAANGVVSASELAIAEPSFSRRLATGLVTEVMSRKEPAFRSREVALPRIDWWQLALSWFKWWRGRWMAAPTGLTPQGC